MREEVPDLPIERLSYSVQEAGFALDISAHTLKRAISFGLIRATNIGTRLLIPADEVKRLAAEGLPKIPVGWRRKAQPAKKHKAVRGSV